MSGAHTPHCAPACPACRHAADQAAVRDRLTRATAGLDLSRMERNVLDWLPRFEVYTAEAVAGLLDKARAAGRLDGAGQ